MMGLKMWSDIKKLSLSKMYVHTKSSLKNYFKDKPMHFVTQKFYEKSKVVTRKETETSQLIFMD